MFLIELFKKFIDFINFNYSNWIWIVIFCSEWWNLGRL